MSDRKIPDVHIPSANSELQLSKSASPRRERWARSQPWWCGVLLAPTVSRPRHHGAHDSSIPLEPYKQWETDKLLDRTGFEVGSISSIHCTASTIGNTPVQREQRILSLCLWLIIFEQGSWQDSPLTPSGFQVP